MTQETIEYLDGSQKLLSELVYDKRQMAADKPAILVFPAFEGRGEFTLDYAKKFAEHGHPAMAVDVYGDGAVAKTIDECFQWVQPFLHDRSLVRKRALLAYKNLSQHPVMAQRKIAAIGFCFGGMCVLELARSGENLFAGVSAHGVLGKSELPTKNIKGKLLILHGYRDPQSPPDAFQKFAEEMDAANAPDWIFTFFSHAKHSFTDPRTGSFDAAREEKMGREYHQQSAERTLRYSLDFFAEIT